MKKLIALLALMASVVLAQVAINPVKVVPTNPSGACPPGRIALSAQDGNLYYCDANTMVWAIPGGGAGTGTVTSVGLVGTANQITVTGASPITTAGSWTLSIASGFTLPFSKITGDTNSSGGTFTIDGGTLDATGGGVIAATGLQDATGVVSVVGSAAPSMGDVLTATDATHATWQPAASGSGTVTSIATTSPITGGTITTTGTIACATCVTSAAALTSGQLMTGAGSQASQVGNLSGDATTSGSTAVTVVKVNGIAYSATAAAHSVEVITTANTTATAKVIPDCTDTGGNHLNFTQSTDAFSCGTSGGSSGLTVGTTTISSGTSGAFLYNNSGTLGNVSVVPGLNGGGLVLLEQHAASNSATLDFTTFISSTYDDYVCEGVDIISATNAVNLIMQVGTGAGPTYDTSAHYNWNRNYEQIGVDFSTAGSKSGAAAIAIVLSVIQSSSGPTQFTLRFNSPASSNQKLFRINSEQIGSDGNPYANFGGAGHYNQTTALTALRFKMDSGNITSGTIRCYGVAK